jgi:hypothetical protein
MAAPFTLSSRIQILGTSRGAEYFAGIGERDVTPIATLTSGGQT